MLTGPHIKKLNFDRCDHKVLGACSTQAEGCCGVVACNLCIQITSDYTDEVVDRKVAPFSSPGYAATLGVVVFEAYWRRDYTTDECVFIVEVTDAVETQVLEFSKCYDAASCMAPAGSVAIQYDGKPHVLSWEPLDIVTLRHRVEGKCKKPFCGLCTCAPREICVTLTAGGCNVSELVALEPSECKEEEPPVWEFTLACPHGGPTVSGTVSVLREEYTNACLLSVVIPAYYVDVEYEWTECPDIDELEISFKIPGDYGYGCEKELDALITIKPADCGPCDADMGDVCCIQRPCDDGCTPNPVPETLTVVLSATITEECTGLGDSGFDCPANSNCFNFSFELQLTECVDPRHVGYGARVEHECSWCGETFTLVFDADLTCFGILRIIPISGPWLVIGGSTADAGQVIGESPERSCLPILTEMTMSPCVSLDKYCYVGTIEGDVPILAIHPPMCLHAVIYE